MYKLDWKKAEEPYFKLSTSAGSEKKQGNSRKTYTYYSLTILKPLTMWITTNCVDNNKLWKILEETRIRNHLTCLLRNLHADQEPTVRIRHGTTDWIKIGKGVHEGCIVSPCLFNLYAAAAAKSLQSCLTLCNPRDGSPPVPVILQARTLEWLAISFSNAWEVKSENEVAQ